MFVETLATAAADAAGLQAGLQQLQWAAGFQEAPGMWEEGLRDLPAATQVRCICGVQCFLASYQYPIMMVPSLNAFCNCQ